MVSGHSPLKSFCAAIFEPQSLKYAPRRACYPRRSCQGCDFVRTASESELRTALLSGLLRAAVKQPITHRSETLFSLCVFSLVISMGIYITKKHTNPRHVGGYLCQNHFDGSFGYMFLNSESEALEVFAWRLETSQLLTKFQIPCIIWHLKIGKIGPISTFKMSVWSYSGLHL